MSDRDLTVLNALLSFHPDTDLAEGENLVVFPSNRALAERALVLERWAVRLMDAEQGSPAAER